MFLREFRKKNMITILESKQYPNADSSQSGVLSKKDLLRIAVFGNIRKSQINFICQKMSCKCGQCCSTAHTVMCFIFSQLAPQLLS